MIDIHIISLLAVMGFGIDLFNHVVHVETALTFRNVDFITSIVGVRFLKFGHFLDIRNILLDGGFTEPYPYHSSAISSIAKMDGITFLPRFNGWYGQRNFPILFQTFGCVTQSGVVDFSDTVSIDQSQIQGSGT